MKIGIINNCSAVPFLMLATPPSTQAVYDNPRRIAELARSRDIAAGLISAAAITSATDYMQPLPYGIVSRQAAISVKLFCQYPITRLLNDNIPVAEDDHSLTAIELLKTLCLHDYQLIPEFMDTPGQQAVAKLLIGNQAVIESRKNLWPYTYDLGTWWYTQTGLPMVWAVWMSSDNSSKIENWITSSLEFVSSAEGRQRHLDILGKDIVEPEHYTDNLYYTLGEREQQSITLFQQRINRI